MFKNFKKSIFICFFAVSLIHLNLQAENLPSPFIIIPQPQKIELLNEKGFNPENLKYICLLGEFEFPVLGKTLSRLPISKIDGKERLTLILDTTVSLPSEEGYILTINKDRIQIRSKTQAGLFYGCQSLEQLFDDAADFNKPIPTCIITDYPIILLRAVHFDVKHHLDYMNYYYESIDRLARYKINAVVFEFEDKLRYQRQPKVAAPQSISIDEMAALTRYAKRRHIEIIPLVQGLGHATFILKHPEYSNLRELSWNTWAFCPLHEGTYQVLFDLYKDAIDATPGSKYLHVGGDEIGNIGLCPRCKPMADKEGMLSLSLYWLKRVCDFARENNRIPIFWDDMPLKEGQVYESTWSDEVTSSEASKAWELGISKLDSLLIDFPKNCIYMRWNYSMAKQPGNINALNWYKSRGLNAMIATATNPEGGMLFQAEERDKGPLSSGVVSIQSFIQLAAERNISGVLCTAWDDKSPHMENYWRGFIATAEYAWKPEGRTLEEYDKAWLQREFGVSIPDYVKFNDQYRNGSVFWYEAFYKNGSLLDDSGALQSLPRLEHWLKPIEGQEKLVIDYTSKLIDLPDTNFPGNWSLKYKDRIDKAQIELDNFENNKLQLLNLYNSSKRNRYYWALSMALYELQITAPRIFLALKQSDSADKEQMTDGLEKLKSAILEYKTAWNNLNIVYSQTRFVSYPANYLPDRYFHLASQKEDLSWMIQAEELYVEMLEDWLKIIKY